MYWPLGAPRVYAASKKKTVGTSKSDQGNRSDGDKLDSDDQNPTALLGLRVSRNGHLFATITATTLTVWQTLPVVVLASITRSPQSLKSYGRNVTLLLKPDSTIAVVQTQLGFLITYSITADPSARVYRQLHEHGHGRRQSKADSFAIEEERDGVQEVNVRFRMVIKLDAGIGKALALDEELVVATEKPAAVQCIRWIPDNNGGQHSTELLSRMAWIPKKSVVVDMVFDRAMSLAIWITSDGKAHAVQRMSGNTKEKDAPRGLFRGHCFHTSDEDEGWAVRAAINARFSLLAVACASGEIHVYSAKDYAGSISLSYKIEPPASISTTGQITFLSHSPDGYCLFAGYERGWAIWSVYGKLGGSSFVADRTTSENNSEGWLVGILEAAWLSGGSSILLATHNDNRLWVMEMAKSAVTGCFCAANVSRTVLLTTSSLMIYRGYELPTLTAISADAALWHHVQIPAIYLANQLPIRCAVISSDGRYVAIAGRRGLAHYSVTSGRWKTFDDSEAENSFVVRGGMCWYQHILIAAVETDESHELRLYSREHGLDRSSLVYTERLSYPAVVMSLSGQDSLLVYTYENILHHFVINASNTAVTLVKVGQIALNGIVRAPARVRAVSWILPDHQLRDGDPSQDVAHASVIFLVDAKLVLLQSSLNEEGSLKYDMRVIANHVEYFDLMRDQVPPLCTPAQSPPESPSNESPIPDFHAEHGLKDSLWFFDGVQIQCWIDVEDLLQSASTENDRGLPDTVSISTDFYPSSIILRKGIILGVDAELVQRRDVSFAIFRFSIRTQLFLPQILRRYLSLFDTPAASSLSHRYNSLPYFSHALEILLHTVLDDEVDNPPTPPSESLLPSVLSFLSSFPSYLDILVQCTRKTEVRSWRTLFAHLPPPQTLFEASLRKGMLKTAGGYLLVLHTFDEGDANSEQCVRLLQKATEAGDWDLCKELARFLMALDPSGDELRAAVELMRLDPAFCQTSGLGGEGSDAVAVVRLRTPKPYHRGVEGRGGEGEGEAGSGGGSGSGARVVSGTVVGLGIGRDGDEDEEEEGEDGGDSA